MFSLSKTIANFRFYCFMGPDQQINFSNYFKLNIELKLAITEYMSQIKSFPEVV